MSNNPLQIAALPLNIKWANREANLVAVEQAAAGLRPGTDLLVLPELFTTAFIADPEVLHRLAEPDDGVTMTRLRQLAAERRIAIAGSFLACNESRTEFYNRAFIMEPNGETVYCNKRHLFHLSPEAKLLTPGHTPYSVVRFRGWNLAVGVCYDLRYPVWCRNRSNEGLFAYDIFIFAANWPESRSYALETLSKARAIENQAYVVVCNRSGEDDYGTYDGLSFIHDEMGKTLAKSDKDEIIYVEAVMTSLEETRRRMPASLDADKFTIKY